MDSTLVPELDEPEPMRKLIQELPYGQAPTGRLLRAGSYGQAPTGKLIRVSPDSGWQRTPINDLRSCILFINLISLISACPSGFDILCGFISKIKFHQSSAPKKYTNSIFKTLKSDLSEVLSLYFISRIMFDKKKKPQNNAIIDLRFFLSKKDRYLK